jgi:hypothetical protein
MGFDVPNESEAFLPEQSTLFSTDLDILAQAIAGEGVVSGCAVTWKEALIVTVGAGVIHIDADVDVAEEDVIASAADGTRLRVDLVVVNADDAKSVLAGDWDDDDNPIMPAIPAGSVALAALYVEAGATALSADHIIDKRVILAALAGGMAQHGDEYHSGRIEDAGPSLPETGEDGEQFYLTADKHLYVFQA